MLSTIDDMIWNHPDYSAWMSAFNESLSWQEEELKKWNWKKFYEAVVWDSTTKISDLLSQWWTVVLPRLNPLQDKVKEFPVASAMFQTCWEIGWILTLYPKE